VCACACDVITSHEQTFCSATYKIFWASKSDVHYCSTLCNASPQSGSALPLPHSTCTHAPTHHLPCNLVIQGEKPRARGCQHHSAHEKHAGKEPFALENGPSFIRVQLFRLGGLPSESKRRRAGLVLLSCLHASLNTLSILVLNCCLPDDGGGGSMVLAPFQPCCCS